MLWGGGEHSNTTLIHVTICKQSNDSRWHHIVLEMYQVKPCAVGVAPHTGKQEHVGPQQAATSPKPDTTCEFHASPKPADMHPVEESTAVVGKQRVKS